MKKSPDLTALTLLKVLYETRNLVNAAERLGMPPATASRHLAMLRELFGDELFSRCAGGFAPTWHMEEIMPSVLAILGDYEKLLKPKTFSPKDLDRVFRVAGVDHCVFFLAPAVAQISKAAPGASLELSELTNDWPNQLSTGNLDAVISPIETVPEGFSCLNLIENIGTSVVVRPGHPLEEKYLREGAIYERDVLEYGFVEITFRPSAYYRLQQSRFSGDYAGRRVVVRTPYFMTGVKFVASSNLVMTLSNVMSEWFIELGALHRIPVVGFGGELPFTPKLIWHERSHNDPAMQWFRGMISSGIKKTFEGEGKPAI